MIKKMHFRKILQKCQKTALGLWMAENPEPQFKIQKKFAKSLNMT